MAGMFAIEATLEVDNKSGINLTEEQQDAVNAPLPTVVLSCAGTGKTTTLIERIIKANEIDNISFEDMYVTSFSRSAAQNIIVRLAQRYGMVPPYIGTFHRNCLFKYRNFPQLLNCHGYKPTRLTILSPARTDEILRRLFEAHGECQDWCEKNYINLEDAIDKCRDLIDKCKSLGLYPIDYHMNKAFDYTTDLEIAGFLEANLNTLPMSFFFDIFKEFQEELKLANTLDFNDVISLATFALRDDDIRSNVAAHFKIIVVDEFQDCSKMQFELVSHLSNNFENAYLVGDEDQLLYAWRDADIDTVMNFYKDERSNLKILQGNFRSTKPIIDLAVAIIVENNQRYNSKIMQPMREIEDPAPVYVMQPYDNKFEAEVIASKIKQYIDDKVVEPKEIAIIYAYHDYRFEIEKALTDLNIDYHMVKGYNFLDYAIVKATLGYLTLALDRDNDESFRLVEGFFFEPKVLTKYELSNLEKLASKNETSLYHEMINNDKIKSKEGVVSLISMLNEMKSILENNQSIEKVFECIDTNLNPESMLRIKHGAKESKEHYSRFIQLQDRLETYHQAYRNYQESINEIWNQMADTDKEEYENKIRLMTAHASKGLEFKIVFIIGAVNGIFPSFQLGSNIEDSRRVFYVAVTRAKDELVISAPRYVNKTGTVVEYELTMFLNGKQQYYTFIAYDKFPGFKKYISKNSNTIKAAAKKITLADAPAGFYGKSN